MDCLSALRWLAASVAGGRSFIVDRRAWGGGRSADRQHRGGC